MQASNAQVTTDLATSQAQLQAAEKQKAELGAELSKAAKAREDLAAEMKALKAEVEAQKTQSGTEVERIRVHAAMLEGEVAKAKEENDTLRAHLASLSEVAQFYKTTAQQKEGLEKEIATLREQLASSSESGTVERRERF